MWLGLEYPFSSWRADRHSRLQLSISSRPAPLNQARLRATSSGILCLFSPARSPNQRQSTPEGNFLALLFTEIVDVREPCRWGQEKSNSRWAMHSHFFRFSILPFARLIFFGSAGPQRAFYRIIWISSCGRPAWDRDPKEIPFHFPRPSAPYLQTSL